MPTSVSCISFVALPPAAQIALKMQTLLRAQTVHMSPENPQSPAQLTKKYSHAGLLPPPSSLAEHVSLKLQQLSHEGQVRGDDLTPLLYKIKGFV